MTEKKEDTEKNGRKIKELKSEVYKNKKVIGELEARIKYMQADFENYKKHIDKEKEVFAQLAAKDLIMDLLVFLDDIESAVKRSGDNGLKNLMEKIMKILKLHGLEQINAKGKFDHYYHEAVMQGEGEEGQIIEELQKGYMLNGIVIRHSKVKVGKGK